jgi:uncharacterized protein (DUF2147 family)
MSTNELIISILALAAAASATSPSPLDGVWSEIDGPGAARIAPCPNQSQTMCAFALRKKAGSAPVASDGHAVLKAVVPDGNNRWKGTYIDGSRALPATLRFAARDVVEMKVCILFICQSARYRRVG